MLVLDRGELTGGSTFHSAGLVGQLRSTIALTRINMASVELYRRLHDDTGLDPGWRQVGSLRLASSRQRLLGMVLAFAFSARLKLLAPDQAARVERHLAAVGLPTHLRSIPGGAPQAERLIELIAQDKKVRRGKLTFILARGIGDCFVVPDIEADEVRAFLLEKLSEQ